VEENKKSNETFNTEHSYSVKSGKISEIGVQEIKQSEYGTITLESKDLNRIQSIIKRKNH
jgi:hypothetical protein